MVSVPISDRKVLDAFALIALFQHEPGGPRVLDLLEKAAIGQCELSISVVNLGEVLYGIERRKGLEAAQEALGYIDRSPIHVVDIQRGLALRAARLKVYSRMGYLDCLAAALAQHLEATLVTGDRDFQQVEGMIPIEWLPQGKAG